MLVFPFRFSPVLSSFLFYLSLPVSSIPRVLNFFPPYHFFSPLFLELPPDDGGPVDGGSTSARRSIHRGRIMQKGEKRTIANCLGISRKSRNQDVSLLFPLPSLGVIEKKREKERDRKKITLHISQESQVFRRAVTNAERRRRTLLDDSYNQSLFIIINKSSNNPRRRQECTVAARVTGLSASPRRSTSSRARTAYTRERKGDHFVG